MGKSEKVGEKEAVLNVNAENTSPTTSWSIPQRKEYLRSRDDGCPLCDMDEVQPLVSSEVFIGPDGHDSVLNLLRTEGHAAGGICVLTPYSLSICYQSGYVIIGDSHSHGTHGALNAVIPTEKFGQYLKHF